mmetsp:Transcript_30709/g.49429  ORF Transcript_30709/g.49429 Transcript_30709/m.49429 type:complete len:95 (+) Transcript_30709:120-404(+)
MPPEKLKAISNSDVSAYGVSLSMLWLRLVDGSQAQGFSRMLRMCLMIYLFLCCKYSTGMELAKLKVPASTQTTPVKSLEAQPLKKSPIARSMAW